MLFILHALGEYNSPHLKGSRSQKPPWKRDRTVASRDPEVQTDRSPLGLAMLEITGPGGEQQKERVASPLQCDQGAEGQGSGPPRMVVSAIWGNGMAHRSLASIHLLLSGPISLSFREGVLRQEEKIALSGRPWPT